MAPIILKTDIRCLGCAKKIRNSIKNMFGVEGVWASQDTGLVIVTGTADARALRWRIQHRTRRPVTIVSDGTEEGQPDRHCCAMHHHHAQPPAGACPYGDGCPAPRPRHRYGALPLPVRMR